MDCMRYLKNLCSPAMFYLVLSVIGLIVISMQNMNNNNSYHMGTFSCRVPSTMFILIIKFICVLFWTYVLNLICKDGHKGLSWFLVLLPWILVLVIMGMIMIQ